MEMGRAHTRLPFVRSLTHAAIRIQKVGEVLIDGTTVGACSHRTSRPARSFKTSLRACLFQGPGWGWVSGLARDCRCKTTSLILCCIRTSTHLLLNLLYLTRFVDAWMRSLGMSLIHATMRYASWISRSGFELSTQYHSA